MIICYWLPWTAVYSLPKGLGVSLSSRFCLIKDVGILTLAPRWTKPCLECWTLAGNSWRLWKKLWARNQAWLQAGIHHWLLWARDIVASLSLGFLSSKTGGGNGLDVFFNSNLWICEQPGKRRGWGSLLDKIPLVLNYPMLPCLGRSPHSPLSTGKNIGFSNCEQPRSSTAPRSPLSTRLRCSSL